MLSSTIFTKLRPESQRRQAPSQQLLKWMLGKATSQEQSITVLLSSQNWTSCSRSWTTFRPMLIICKITSRTSTRLGSHSTRTARTARIASHLRRRAKAHKSGYTRSAVVSPRDVEDVLCASARADVHIPAGQRRL